METHTREFAQSASALHEYFLPIPNRFTENAATKPAKVDSDGTCRNAAGQFLKHHQESRAGEDCEWKLRGSRTRYSILNSAPNANSPPYRTFTVMNILSRFSTKFTAVLKTARVRTAREDCEWKLEERCIRYSIKGMRANANSPIQRTMAVSNIVTRSCQDRRRMQQKLLHRGYGRYGSKYKSVEG